MAAGLRRRALLPARVARPALHRPGLPRPLPDRRCPDAGRSSLPVAHRALVLVRPALPPGPVRAAAPAAGRRLADRLPAWLGRGPGGGGAAGAGSRPRRGDAGGRDRLRARMGQRVQLPLPADGTLPPRAHLLPRRQRAPGLALRRARRQWRRAGRGQSLLETGRRARGPGAGGAARQLRRRAHSRGRREHPQLHAQHRLHHTEEPRRAGVPRCGARAGGGAAHGAAAGEFGPSLAPLVGRAAGARRAGAARGRA